MKRGFRIKYLVPAYVVVFLMYFLSQSGFSQTKAHIKGVKTTLQLGSLFKDHMVLQRNMSIPVWGKGKAGAEINVQFANSEKRTIVDSEGNWKLKLKPLKASFDAQTMSINSSNNKQSIKIVDILIGDVWICSGQSNMQFGVNGAPEVRKLVPSAKNIRSFKVKNTVSLVPQDTCEGTWEVKHPNSAVAFSFAYFLEKSANVPVGIILTAWGSSSLEAWMPKDMVETVPHFKTMMEEFDADDKTKNRITAILNGKKPWGKEDDIFLRRQSNILYNAMMHPLMPYACKGIVWYQGERNTQSMNEMVKEPWYYRHSGMLKYGDVLKEWVKRYRKGWDNNDLHFLVVMLPGYGKELKTDKNIAANTPNAHSWAWMRESQLKVLELPHTSVANIIDLGDYKNIHPKDKLPVGKRLALLARKDVLGEKITALGPTLKKVRIKKNTVIVRFKNAKKIKTTDGKRPTGFWLADEANRWFPAKATIKGKRVILTSSSLENPLYVRYAFTGKPDVNLENEANLPAYPFRTDSFKP